MTEWSNDMVAEDERALGVGFTLSCCGPFARSGGGSAPPDIYEGHRERSSGNERPPVAEGSRCERIAAA